ncbi:ABC transporter permease subunit [Solirhodobacter olei]|uniref:ABC transporter permease subunit n=1 Tax=Solirhodobacter olei TaxID=2493082 RepID=UPI000FD991F8|nr:ABC transporter permease subunit [Solirhodobacter olei]
MLSMFTSRKARAFALQAIFLAVVIAVIGGAFVEGRRNLAAQGITFGFGFLNHTTGFDVGFKLISYDSYSTYSRLIFLGILDSLFVGAFGIVAANLVGLVIAIMRTAGNSTFNALGTVYVEIFRNIPLILQVVFWYALLTRLPPPRHALSGFDSFLTSRGVYIPGLNVTGGHAAAACAIVIAGLTGLTVLSMSRRLSRLPFARLLRWGVGLATLSGAVLTLHLGRISGTPLVSLPKLQGFNIQEGIRISPEFLSLLIGMAVYGGAYISEIIRAGFLATGKGQVEAAQSLGLTPWQVFHRVRLPLAIRAVLPTLINQYVWLFKATTLGIAVGYTDFFAVISVSINQAGHTLELIGILMLGFLVINNAMALVLNRVNKAIALRGNQLRS